MNRDERNLVDISPDHRMGRRGVPLVRTWKLPAVLRGSLANASLVILLIVIAFSILLFDVFHAIHLTLGQNEDQLPVATAGGEVLPSVQMRPEIQVNIREFTRKISDDIRLIANRTSCVNRIARFYENEGEYQKYEPERARELILSQIYSLLNQHKLALQGIVSEAEKAAAAHNFIKNLRVNYTDVHRLRNELEPIPINLSPEQLNDYTTNQYGAASSSGFSGTSASGDRPQFTSISGGTPVPGPPEWQTPIKSIVMQVNRNFGDIPVNISMSAVHLPLPTYPGQPEIMNGIAWTEHLDAVFRRNLIQNMHVHHQYYGDRLGFLRTFPAHKWRIPRNEPDLFDARTRPWYIAGAATPKDVVILVDSSGSMTGLRREIARGVVFEILDTLTINDHFAVLRFSESVTPVGLPKCNLKTPRLVPQLEKQCSGGSSAVRHIFDQYQTGGQSHRSTPNSSSAENSECVKWRHQWDSRGQYLRDHPNLVPGLNGSYLTDDAYRQSIANVSLDIRDAFLLPATSRNVRYLKSNFSMPTAGIANFTRALMAGFELLQAYNRSSERGSQCSQAIMLITDGAIRSQEEVFNRYNYPNAPIRVFTYMIGREVGDIRPTKEMACKNRGYYTHVINLGEVREQVQKYLPVMARPLVLAQLHPTTWTNAYGDETHQVLTDWVLELKRRERARLMLNEERDRQLEDTIDTERTGIAEYDEIPQVEELLKNRIICEDAKGDPQDTAKSLEAEIDPLGHNELGCHWSNRRADLLTSVVKPVFDLRNTSIFFEPYLSKNVWDEREIRLRNAQLLGVAAVDLRIDEIMRAAPSHQLGPNAYPILLGQNGFVMSHPNFRPLLEDPFDKQSLILKPYFSAVDLTHIEQVYHKNETDFAKRREEDSKLVKLREAALKRTTGSETMTVKRAIDCRRRPHIRQQTFYYGPIKDTPYSFMLALPQSYGLNRMRAKLALDQNSYKYLSPNDFDVWTLHPDYRYCEPASTSQTAHLTNQMRLNDSLSTIIRLLNLSAEGKPQEVEYKDLSIINSTSTGSDDPNASRGRSQQRYQTMSSPTMARFVCDKELFPSLLFDARATYDSFVSSAETRSRADVDEDGICTQTNGEMSPLSIYLSAIPRTKLAQIYGLEMSFVAMRSGLTRTRIFDNSTRIRKLAALFIQRHGRAVDESWYSRTVDYNMRFNDEATVLSVAYNAYARLVAKLRQRITMRHPAANDTRANCDPSLLEGLEGETGEQQELTQTSANQTMQIDAGQVEGEQNDAPNPAPEPELGSEQQVNETDDIDYSNYSSFEMLDLIANSSVHVAAFQSIILNKSKPKMRTPVGVTGHLYDYANFARRFLNTTSLEVRSYGVAAGQLDAPPSFKVELCSDGNCRTKCGNRNDSIDCLLVDNNGFIVVGEELAHVGRSLVDYDEKLMQSLVERRVFRQVQLVDYQAICTRNEQPNAAELQQQQQQRTASSNLTAMLLAVSSSAGHSATASALADPFRFELVRSLMANFASALVWTVSSVYSAFLLRSATESDPTELFGSESLIGRLHQWQRSALLADAQTALANQTLLASLPNKTYLRPCERTTTLYETRAAEPTKLNVSAPEYYVTRCGCSGWYVYDAVQRTNLIMLIVNTSSSCRLCPDQPGAQSVPVAPVVVTPLLEPPKAPEQSSPRANPAEDQVCAMLERDQPLFVQSPASCLTGHPEESQIQICGSATRPNPPQLGVLMLMAVLLIWANRHGAAQFERVQPDVTQSRGCDSGRQIGLASDWQFVWSRPTQTKQTLPQTNSTNHLRAIRSKPRVWFASGPSRTFGRLPLETTTTTK